RRHSCDAHRERSTACCSGGQCGPPPAPDDRRLRCRGRADRFDERRAATGSDAGTANSVGSNVEDGEAQGGRPAGDHPMTSRPFLAALLGASLLCAPARADDAAEREGRALFAKGNQHVKDGDYAGALELFQSAYAKYPNVKILLNIGTMLSQLGRSAEAVEAYEAYLRDPAADPGRKAEVAKLLAALDARVAKLRVVVDDPKATVLVDGKVTGQPGGMVSMRIEPGPHAISAKREGGQPVVKNI